MAGTIDSFSYVLSNAKHFNCSCHATWLPCKTSIVTSYRLFFINYFLSIILSHHVWVDNENTPHLPLNRHFCRQASQVQPLPTLLRQNRFDHKTEGFQTATKEKLSESQLIDQFRYIKIQSETKGIISGLWGITIRICMSLFPRASRWCLFVSDWILTCRK